MVVSASLVSYQRPFSCHPGSPFLVIPVLDTGSPYDGVIQVASIQCPFGVIRVADTGFLPTKT